MDEAPISSRDAFCSPCQTRPLVTFDWSWNRPQPSRPSKSHQAGGRFFFRDPCPLSASRTYRSARRRDRRRIRVVQEPELTSGTIEKAIKAISYAGRDSVGLRSGGPDPDDRWWSQAFLLGCDPMLPGSPGRRGSCLSYGESRGGVGPFVHMTGFGEDQPCSRCGPPPAEQFERAGATRRGEDRVLSMAIDVDSNLSGYSSRSELGETRSRLRGARIRASECSLFPIDFLERGVNHADLHELQRHPGRCNRRGT
jgi:hypothetical protein